MKILPIFAATVMLSACASSPSGQDNYHWHYGKNANAESLINSYKNIPRAAGKTDNPEDKDALPLVRVPPIFPPNANKSGHCMMKYDVTPYGTPTLISVISCSDRIFAKGAIRALKQWKFNPKIVLGEQVRRYGVQTKISYRLSNEKGIMIPE